ncbi:hypothetical protein CEUSTIGMA_g1139.t1 [Chlamydomonas eustigma]|uniref:Iron permease FTR1 family protein n=1 Tax=Chlamydomonas eustigma TaxID=1157962 RepID=A0A250WS87_9CHLO|nr:hypothetical protein CEUSTIGMA_g1139.t1 [Chlamydomonas eustigma]|eukprot:GAX73688.1 hypothetical protein CEUSTIGMA_g1139.t1 [Chlamydomonas eustigma]
MGASASTYFNPVPLFILFREAIEASIVVSILLTFVNRSNPALKGQGVIAWVASAFITYLSFAMLRYKGWEDKWARKLTGQKTLEMSAQSFSSPAVTNGVLVSNDAPIAKLDDACCNIELGQDAVHVSQVDSELGIIKVNPSPSSHLQSPPASALPGDETKLDRDALCCHEETVAQIDEPAMKVTDAATELVVLPDTADIFDAQKSDYSCQRSWVSRLREGKGFFGHYSLFFTSFFTILREGVESVVFLFGIGNAAPESIPISGAVGTICGMSVGFVLYFSGKQVKDIKWLLYIFATVLFFIAAGSCENGADWLMQAGFSDGDEGPVSKVADPNDGYLYLKTTSQPWWQTPMWDISGSPCCGDTDQENRFLSMCKTLFGYNAKPCFIDALFYLVYWLVVLCLGLYKWHDGSLSDADYKYKRMLRKQ